MITPRHGGLTTLTLPENMKLPMKLKIARATVVSFGIVLGLAWLPGPVEGLYSVGEASCLCGGKSFMRLIDGKIITYNTSHAPAQLIGKYTADSNGMVKLSFLDEKGKEDDFKTLLSRPYLFLLSTPPVAGKPSGWDFRCPEWGAVSQALREHDIVKQRTESDGSITKEFFDSHLTALRTEKNADQADEGVSDEL